MTGVERIQTAATDQLPIVTQACAGIDEVVAALGSDIESGLTTEEADRRERAYGPNALRTHRARAWAVLGHQLRSALLLLLLVTAAISFVLGERNDAIIIGIILAASIGMGFVNEYRAERATEALHSSVHHQVVVIRGGAPLDIDVVQLVPGDIVHLGLGSIVPADIRLSAATNLECDESVLTGESLPSAKGVLPVSPGLPLGDLTCVAFMGTVVHQGSGVGIVVGTGTNTEFGRIAAGLGERQPETDFQVGLRQFSVLLLQVALTLAVLILITNLLLHRGLIESLLFSLAIAVGITPQLLPAVVSTSLAAGSRSLARQRVLVKRLVCIEDLGDMDILVTDKTGTLTQGRISFTASLDPTGGSDTRAQQLGLLAADVESAKGSAVGGNSLDVALWGATPHDLVVPCERMGEVPFDHERRMNSVVVREAGGRTRLVVKGAPESVLAACDDVPPSTQATLDMLFATGSRVVAVAERDIEAVSEPTVSDECNLTLVGYLVFEDPPKETAGRSLQRLASLGVHVKIATGDNAEVARKLCADFGLTGVKLMNGQDIDALDDTELVAAVDSTDVFARITPEHKARVVRALRRHGRAVGFLGDGVNDALALHEADVGISVDSATDVAKDAADVVLLEKSLDVLADGVVEGRRIFANTIKYVLMGTSSNFGNMFSAAAASALLAFLPMLPSQILLNNLLYDSSEMFIPTDHVDAEQLAAPSHWNIAYIRRFMLVFGPVSSLFDFMTFGIMLGPLHAGPELFRSGWFIESLSTQTLAIFALRTRRVPFFRSRPSMPLTVASFVVVAIGAYLPLSSLAHVLGFSAPPLAFYLALVGMVMAYLVLLEMTKKVFYAEPFTHEGGRRRGRMHLVHRRAARFSV